MRPHVLVTRPGESGAELSRELEVRDIAATCVPTVAIDAESCSAELRSRLRSLDDAEWLVITSANGADAVARAAGSALPASLRVAAVGPSTAAALRAGGLRVDHVPSVYTTAAIAAGLGDVAGRLVVLARADAATDDLRAALTERGARVDEVIAYRTIAGPPESRDPLHAALQRDLSGVAFASSSAVRGLIRLTSSTDRARARALQAFCIGPVTATTAQARGFHVAAVAPVHTASGLADAIAAHLGTAA